ncbi:MULTISPECIES: hypothetical protein [Moorena]|uniref:hypothetical protein n=1 Tax=Moorena TaxID=1155738 RepID=UPI0012B56C13|nr:MULTISPECIES: hypothetical protein [Moorena]NEQ13500.1 hypothetical protein [Moorena sp. SIO3E2]NEP30170.1 hypothetical protein [Moorena sp. SIO3B2]NEP64920.1 hypothetical protein [Moorena sp. SIO3A5]NEQ04975.1 hypothetical protein [Moorena sp. SIO4E2]NER87423.1 hypothetical protein [Moorena sp. SIO3A2]
MGETTAVAHGGNPQDRTASPRPRCIALAFCLLSLISSLLPTPDSRLPKTQNFLPHPI